MVSTVMAEGADSPSENHRHVHITFAGICAVVSISCPMLILPIVRGIDVPQSVLWSHDSNLPMLGPKAHDEMELVTIFISVHVFLV